jgi:hypothetical protein
MKTGKNDLCQCGSGKKYKHCCLGKKIMPIGKYLLPFGIQVDTYSIDDIVKPFISSSNAFNNFYKNEKGSIKDDLYWVKSNLEIEQKLGFRKGQMGKLYRAVGNNEIKRFIVLEEIPSSIKNDFLIAHEIMHDIIFNEGFPGVAPRKPNPFSYEENSKRIRCASALTSMIHDMLCDSRLKKYGFLFDELYKIKIQGVLRNLDQLDCNRTDNLGKLFYMYQYCLTNLQNSLNVNNESNILGRYKQQYVMKYPEITHEGNVILELINDIGYNTPSKLTTLYQEIFRKHKLENEFQLIGQ